MPLSSLIRSAIAEYEAEQSDQQQTSQQQQQTPQVSYSECQGCEERRILFYGYCADCMADSRFMQQARPAIQQQTQPSPYDEQATTLIMRYIDRNETAEDIACQIITRAYEDAAHMRRSDPDPVDFYTPRTDAGDALREYFDELSPLASGRQFILDEGTQTVVTASIFDSLILYALDRVDWYAIVDQLRARMNAEDTALADLHTPEA